MNILNQDRLRVIRWPYVVALLVLLALAMLLMRTLGWEAHAREWANLVVRWLHIIYGIAWIGASFYFIFLENALERQGVRSELSGHIWTLHGGGIYYLEKYKTAPKELPPYLHWFKWDAYLTWVTGLLLLFIVFYADPKASLLAAGSPLSAGAGVLIAVGSLVASWFIYVALSRTALLYKPDVFLLVGGVLVAIAAWLLLQVFNGRAAFLHIGAMIGTIMAANVFFVIIPSQKKLIMAAQKGESLDPAFVNWVQLRSRHNNYLTLPVLFTMISGHFPSTYGGGLNWLILLLLFVAGVAVRHFINITEKRHHETLTTGGAMPYLLVLGTALVLGAFYLTGPKQVSASGGTVSFAQAQGVVQKHCAVCHAAQPTQAGFSSAPGGFMVDSPEKIVAQAARIKQVSVDSQYMPLANMTSMTSEERTLLGQWVAQGAKGP
jgi:uncharacterized membrane protein